MIHSARVRERMKHLGVSQAALGRAVGMTQGGISKVVNGDPEGSSKLHLIARHLRTTPAYLTGEVDDPDEGAPPPRPEPTTQQVSLPVSLPSERALVAAFRGVLLASEGMDVDELAHELAKRLPIVLRNAGDALPSRHSASGDAAPEPLQDPHDAPLERLRA